MRMNEKHVAAHLCGVYRLAGGIVVNDAGLASEAASFEPVKCNGE